MSPQDRYLLAFYFVSILLVAFGTGFLSGASMVRARHAREARGPAGLTYEDGLREGAARARDEHSTAYAPPPEVRIFSARDYLEPPPPPPNRLATVGPSDLTPTPKRTERAP